MDSNLFDSQAKSVAREVALFRQASLVAARSDCCWLGNANPPNLCLSAPKELGHWLCSQNFRLSMALGPAEGVIAKWLARAAGLNLNTNLNLPPDQRVVKVLSAPKSLNKQCGDWNCFRPVENAEIEAAVSWFQPSYPRLFLSVAICCSVEIWLSGVEGTCRG